MDNKYRVGVVGATGMVGTVFLQLLEERQFPFIELKLFASELSEGRTLRVRGIEWKVQTLSKGCFNNLDLVFFSSGDSVSLEWAPQAVLAGAFAVDNSAAFRMEEGVPLIVPEVNSTELPFRKSHSPCVIANPNCSTIQLVMALHPLCEKFGVRDVRVASYQAVSGAGLPAVEELKTQLKSWLNALEALPLETISLESPGEGKNTSVFPHPIAFNLIPQIGSFQSSGFCSEEIKIMFETRKILQKKSMDISALTVRVPVLNAHSEAVWVTLDKEVSEAEFRQALASMPGLKVMDDPQKAVYPMPSTISNLDDVYVGRIHKDLNNPRLWLMWIVGDNLRKGAALNGIQIAERIFDIPFLP